MKKVVIVGPESTGKSTLAAGLADWYKTVWCPEYAREFLLTHGRDYSFDDLLTIARRQVELEDEKQAEASNGFFIIDTNMYVMKVWCEVVFNDCHTWVLKEIVKRRYDLYLLCNTDLPWVQDGLREYPDETMRQKLFKMYKDILINSGVPWTVISGAAAQRLQVATRAIDTLFSKQNR
jgi:NadR type nicotinamide-nucleotide adenylyltransferase